MTLDIDASTTTEKIALLDGLATRDVPQTVRETSNTPVTIIVPRSGWQFVDFHEMWRCRELLYFLIWRDVKVRYKQTVLGAAWAILQPLTQMVVFWIFFKRMANVPSGDITYPLFALSGLLPWMFIANSVAAAANSVVGNQNLLTKVYFPRLFVPASTVGAALVDLGVAFGMLIALMAVCREPTGLSAILVPLITFVLVAAAMGVGTLLAALTAAYRDFRYVVPFMIQVWMFATPSIYMDTSMVGPRWQTVLPLNPAHGLILNFRLALFGQPLDWYALAVSLAAASVVLFAGCLYFRRVERSFADII